jgi:hypothetical protein
MSAPTQEIKSLIEQIVRAGFPTTTKLEGHILCDNRACDRPMVMRCPMNCILINL